MRRIHNVFCNLMKMQILNIIIISNTIEEQVHLLQTLSVNKNIRRNSIVLYDNQSCWMIIIINALFSDIICLDFSFFNRNAIIDIIRCWMRHIRLSRQAYQYIIIEHMISWNSRHATRYKYASCRSLCHPGISIILAGRQKRRIKRRRLHEGIRVRRVPYTVRV